MRKIPAALATLGLVTVGLAGCAVPSADGCVPAAASDSLADLVTVTGSADAAPSVDVKTPFHAEDASFAVLTEGSGTPIVSDDQLVVLDVTLFSGETGERVQGTAYDGALSSVLPVSGWTTALPSWSEALHCATPGSRIVVAMSPDDGVDESTDDAPDPDMAPDVAASLGFAEGESGVAVIDVRKVYLSKADGANQFNAGGGLPSVVRAPDGRPGITIPHGTAPAAQVVQVIKKGDGAEVDDQSTTRIHYTAATWDGDELGSSWGETPQSYLLGTGDAAMDAALEGATVGSQIMVVTPGEGDAAANILVVDVLGIDGVLD